MLARWASRRWTAATGKNARQRKPRRGGVLQTVSLTSLSSHHPGGKSYVSLFCPLRFLRSVHVRKINRGSNLRKEEKSHHVM